MNVTIIGTGNMARGIGSRLLAGGNSVTLLGKEEAAAEGAAEDLRAKASNGAAVETGKFGESGIDDEVVVLAVYYPDAIAAAEQAADQLDGKVVVDITNPVNDSYDALVVAPDGSASKDIAERAPGAKVVKAFNTTFANTLQGEGSFDVFIAGDDEDAKSKVAQLAEAGGLRPIDTGGLARARELEAAGLLHMSVQGTLGSGFQSALRVET